MYYLYNNNKSNPIGSDQKSDPFVDIKLIFNRYGGVGRQKNEKESEIGGFAAC